MLQRNPRAAYCISSAVARLGAALLWTLEKGLGPAFTLEVENAWVAVYAALANTMKEAANEMFEAA